jgi:hypothetical protein
LSSDFGGVIIVAMVVKEKDPSREALQGVQAALREAEERLEELNGTLSDRSRPEDGTTVRELSEQFNVSEEAVRAFAQTAGELLEGEPLSPADARRAAMLAAAGVAWERALGPLLSAGQVRELLGVSRQRVDELLRAERLIGLRERSGRRRYPLFQFEDGRPIEALVAAFYTVTAGLDEWSAASWCTHPDPALDGVSPAQWAKSEGDPERLAVIARQDASRFEQ